MTIDFNRCFNQQLCDGDEITNCWFIFQSFTFKEFLKLFGPMLVTSLGGTKPVFRLHLVLSDRRWRCVRWVLLQTLGMKGYIFCTNNWTLKRKMSAAIAYSCAKTRTCDLFLMLTTKINISYKNVFLLKAKHLSYSPRREHVRKLLFLHHEDASFQT